MKSPSLQRRLALACMALSFLATRPAQAATLWYNGDFDGRDALANATASFAYNVGGTINAYSSFVYDNFTVPTGQTWTISSVFSNNQFYFNNGSFGATVLPTTASWQIRTGMSAGVGGQIYASGDTKATVTAGHVQDNVNYFYNEYQVAAAVPSIVLTAGTYWLTVAPDDPSHTILNFSGVETTSGVNAVGQPMGNDGNSFITNTLSNSPPNPDARTYASTVGDETAVGLTGPFDYSMGVNGIAASVVPEPSSLTLICIAGAGFAVTSRRLARRRSPL